MLFWLLKNVLTVAGLFFTLLGLFVVFHIARSQKGPADASNRINKIRLLWFCLTREDLFVDTFPWLEHDELENVTLDERADFDLDLTYALSVDYPTFNHELVMSHLEAMIKWGKFDRPIDPPNFSTLTFVEYGDWLYTHRTPMVHVSSK